MPCISSEKEKGGIISLDVRFPLPSVPFLAPVSESFPFLLALCTVRAIIGEKTGRPSAPLVQPCRSVSQTQLSRAVQVGSLDLKLNWKQPQSRALTPAQRIDSEKTMVSTSLD